MATLEHKLVSSNWPYFARHLVVTQVDFEEMLLPVIYQKHSANHFQFE